MNELTGYHLSPQQKNVWLKQKEKPLPPAQLVLKVTGELDNEILKAAIQKVIDQDTVFRTTYPDAADVTSPIQFVNEHADFLFFEVAGDTSVQAIQQLLEKGRTQLIDHKKNAFLRVDLLNENEKSHLLVLTLPALYSDFYGLAVLASELTTAYALLLSDLAIEGQELLPYLQFSEWQNQLMESDEKDDALIYWNAIPTPTSSQLSFDRDPNQHEPYSHQLMHFDMKWNEVMTESFLGLCWQLTLWLLTEKQSRTIGHVNTGRDFKELDRTLGLLSVCLPVTLTLSDNRTFGECLQEYDHAINANDEHKVFYSLSSVAQQFSFAFEFSDETVQQFSAKTVAGVQFEILHREATTDASKIQLRCIRKENLLESVFQFNTNSFGRESIQLISRMYEHIIHQCLENPDRKVGELTLLTTADTISLLDEFNNTTELFERANKTIDQLFEEQAQKQPHAIALIAGSRQFTYKELNDRANALAGYVCEELNINQGDRIAIMCGENEHLIIGMLAIIKAGAAYVPVDPANPAERMNFILEDCSAKALLTETVFKEQSGSYKGRIIFMDDEQSLKNSNPVIENRRQSESIVYLIYTSGTTGRPKGVMIPDRALVNYVCWLQHAFAITPADRSVLLSSYAFDLGYTSIWGTLLNGASLQLVPADFVKEADVIVDYLIKTNITYIKTTPSFLNILVQASNFHKLAKSELRLIIVGGESIRITDLEHLARIKPEIELVNHYGPTESTIGTIAISIDRTKLKSYRVLPVIGKPISNSYISILDGDQKPVVPGMIGELCISGLGLSTGYLNRPELTDQKFIPHPFKTGMNLYRTGDQAKWMPDGTILFTGRTDEQVKVRGYRVEPSEIESILQQHALIEAAVITARSNPEGEKELVAYLVSKQVLNVPELRSHLDSVLPSYMIPSYFVQLDTLPLTPNGKTDRKRLPDPQGLTMNTGIPYVAPRNEAERNLVEVYQEVLKKQHVGVKEDFFISGGDSIKSIQVVSRLKQKGYALTIQEVLLHPVIEDLAKLVKGNSRVIGQEPVEGIIPLGPSQVRFFENESTEKHHFNQSVLLNSKEELSEKAIRASFDKIVSHHDALRMVYRQTPTGWIQENKGIENAYSLQLFQYTDETDFVKHCQQIQSSINLETGPLLKIAIFKGHEENRLLIVIHHLVMDGVSWRILLDDLSVLYRQFESGESLQLPLKTDSFKHWQEKLSTYAFSDELKKEEAYWNTVTSAKTDNLPLDHVAGSNFTGDAQVQSFVLDKVSTDLLLRKCYKAYRTEVSDILLSVLGLALKNCFGSEKLLVQLEGHGREDISAKTDVTRTIGWFTTVYPFILDMSYSSDEIRQLISVKESLRRIPNKGIGYGVLRYLANKTDAVQPSITFNYLGDFDSSSKNEEQTFGFSDKYRGAEVTEKMTRSSILEISAILVNSELNVSVSYSNKQYTHATIEKLTQLFKQILSVLIQKLASEQNEQLTPADLTYKQLSLEQVQMLNAGGDVEDVFPLSPLQQGLYYHWLSSPSTYLGQMSYRLKGIVSIQAIEKSYELLVSRHTALRTCFTQHVGEELLQVVKKKVASTFHYLDISGKAEFSVEAYKNAEREKGFDLETGSQMRLSVLYLGDNNYEFIWSHHHILMDGWCVGILIREFFQLYDGILGNNIPELPTPYPYATYVKWLMDVDKDHSFSYWRNYLEGYEVLSSLPRINTSKKQPYKSEKRSFSLDVSVSTAMTNVCTNLGITENTFIQTAWGILLGRYNNTNDVVFGSVVSGRPAEVEGVEEMIGLFINTIPVRIRTKEATVIKDLLKEVHQVSVESINHHYVQLAQVQAESELGRELFDHLLVFENFPVHEMMEKELKSSNNSEGLELLSSDGIEQINYDFSIAVIPGSPMQFVFKYDGNQYSASLLGRIEKHFTQIIAQLVKNPDATVHAIDYLSAEEKYQLTEEFNESFVPYAENKTLVALFEEQVEQTPDLTAVVFGEYSISYRRLNEEANRLANYLRMHHAIQKDDLIGIMLERSDRMVVAMIGVLKSGAAYVPIDPEYPKARKEFITKDTGIQVLITQTAHIFDLDYYAGEVFAMDAQQDSLNTSTSNTGTNVQPQDLAYVIYTSGSTGQPKGVMIEHRAIANTVQAQKTIFELKEGVRGLQFASSSFDASVWELFSVISSGGTLHIVNEECKKDAVALENYIFKNKIEFATLPPAYLQLLNMEKLQTINNLITAGEPANRDQVNTFTNYGTYYNAYGPTESSVCASIFKIARGTKIDTGNVPIGGPIPNTRLYILDNTHALQPVGTIGEICIGGAGLARGYLNQNTLTSEKFVSDPFRKGERIYRTGDLGRWLEDGNIEFIGRKDDQVKLRGYRIELTEIENALKAYPGVDAAVLIIKTGKNENKEMLAYVLSKEALLPNELRNYLGNILPAFMMPDHFIHIADLPLTSNGKVDKKKLPSPQGLETADITAYIAPRNETEEKLVMICKEILGVERIGVKDNFFESGGHSLKAIRFLSMLKKEFEVAIKLEEVFSNPTVEFLAEEIARKKWAAEPVNAESDDDVIVKI